MSVIEQSRLVDFLEELPQARWIQALDEIEDSIHPVDRAGTRIWFAFWPLELRQALSGPDGQEEMARIMDLEGKWDLSEQIDASVSLLYGAHYWTRVKKTILAFADTEELGREKSLAERVREIASQASAAEKVGVELLLGISACGLMILRQVGKGALEAVADHPAKGTLLPKDPAKVLEVRKRQSRDGVFGFLKGISRRYEVRWDEKRSHAVIRAIHGQDMAMAGATDEKDYRELDYRRIDGPIPVECRVGSCGYCWVGVLSGRENLSGISPFEKERLAYFGYDTTNGADEPQPHIRLSCQAQCHGDVTLTIPPWNGELGRRHNQAPKKLGVS